MLECCRSHAEAHLQHIAPLQGYDMPLCNHLTSLLRKWGPLLKEYNDLMVLRCSTSNAIGVNAETYRLACSSCGNGSAPVVVIGSRLFYFVWRLSTICATYYTSAEQMNAAYTRLSGSDDWPNVEQLEQVRIAYNMYFTNSWLDTEGLTDLNRQIAVTRRDASNLYLYTVDMAELFVLMHEIQHQIPLFSTFDGEVGMKVEFDFPVKLSPARGRASSSPVSIPRCKRFNSSKRSVSAK